MNQGLTYYRAECETCKNDLWGLRSSRRPGSGWLHEYEPEDEHLARPAEDTVQVIDFVEFQGLSF